MDNETFRILARHFGNAEHIQVEFKAGACPATNGTEIILPDDLQGGGDIMLSALLHECAHVSLTDFRVTPESLNPQQLFVAVNALEDIRIDAQTAAKYPAARQFARVLLEDVIDRNGEQLRKEPHAIQCLKGIIMTAGNNADLAAKLYTPEQQANIARLSQKYIPETEAATDTCAVIDIARRLAVDIALCAPEADQKAQEAQQRANAAQAKADQAEAERRALGEQYSKDAEQQNRDYSEYKTNRTQRRANETKAARAEYEAQNAERMGDTKTAEAKKAEAKAARDCADKRRQAEQAAGARVNSVRDKMNKARVEYDKKAQEAYEAQREAQQATEALAEDISAQFASGQGVSLSGFNSVDIDALRAKTDIQVNRNLAEVIKAALIAKREQAQTDESGNTINARALPEYQTADPENFFITQEQKDYKTRVSFLVDVSGSMGDLDDTHRGGGMTMATDALAALLDATKRAIHEGAPAEMAVYAFGDRKGAALVIDGVDAYTQRDALGVKLMQARDIVGQGTEIIPAINRVSNDLKEFPDHEHIIIIITDADFNQNDAQELRNQANTDGKTIFLGINAFLEGPQSKTHREIFGKYNITRSETAPAILRRAFMDAIA